MVGGNKEGIQTEQWQRLRDLAHECTTPLQQRFVSDPSRAERLSATLGPLYLDYSKHHLDSDILAALQQLADSAQLAEKFQAVFDGEAVNNTESRAANYASLRSWADDNCAETEINTMYQTMLAMTDSITGADWRSATGKAFTDVVNIGIGGSDFGPRLCCDALPKAGGAPRLHFLANIDPGCASKLFEILPADSTLFIVASKSFGTQETRANAQAARAWLAQQGIADSDAQFMAITSKPSAAEAFGIAQDKILQVPEWVGGRFSVWSGFGMALALHAGPEAFRAFLRGGALVDKQLRQALNTNLYQAAPVTLGLLDVWYRNGWGVSSQVILPYEHRLQLLPTYLQQLFMESAGKSVTADGLPLRCTSGTVIWGTEGTNGQHSFHQLLHQGSDMIPCDFIAARHSDTPLPGQHPALLANCLAQSLVLMKGQSAEEVSAQLQKDGMDANNADLLARHKAMPGNKPSTTILLDGVTAESLGALIALYEYRLMTASFIWNINPFDQWGVELGKVVGTGVLQALESGDTPPDMDSSTATLLAKLRG